MASSRTTLEEKVLKNTCRGTTIKDTWRKSRGRVEVGWRDGEKRHTTVIE